MRKKFQIPKEPQRIDWGKAGQEPTKVWETYNWVIIDSDRYMFKEK